MFRQCEALTRKGLPCPNGVVKGESLCHIHIGKEYDVRSVKPERINRGCTALTLKGKVCTGRAITGTSLCLLHSSHEVGVAKLERGSNDMVMMAYREYLKSPRWQTKRRKRLETDGYACVLCHSTQMLEVHHLTYNRLGHERNYDLRTLCHDCHDAVSDAERTLGWQEANAVFYEHTRRGKKRTRKLNLQLSN
jgi:5-methylcytosine-specific restriction endonuclease McrA